MGAFVVGFSSILTGLNFIVTVHKMRAPGMTWFRMPLFVWAQYATSIVMILGTPVLAITIFLLMLEAGDAGRHLRPRPRGRPDFVPAPVLVLLAPGRVHHDHPRLRGDQRDHPLLLAAEDLRLSVHGRGDDGDRPARLPRLGPPHVRQWAVDVRGDRVLDHQLPHRRAPRPSRSSTGRPRFTRARSRPTRRCSTPWATSACS